MGADLFSIGKSGLFASKKSLATTSHNISNVNTEGYSRQQVKTQTNVPLGEGNTVVGSGVHVYSVKRVHDDIVEKKLNTSLTDHKFNEEKTFQLERVEEIFNEINSEGMNKVLNRFFNSMRELSNQPDNETVRSIVRENAKIVINDFRRTRQSLKEVKDGIDSKLSAAVTDINSIGQNIAKLNKEIMRIEIAGGETGDLRDRRDLQIKSLAEYMDVHTYEDERGQFVVSTPGAGSLVAGGIVNELAAGKMLKNENDNKDDAYVEVFFKDKPNNPITGSIRSGKIAALEKTRKEDLKELEIQIDELAFNLSQATNAIHRKGFANTKFKEDENGNPILPQDLSKITGINFFKDLKTIHKASEIIDLSDEVKDDVNNIATALEPNSPGDNRVALAISRLQYEKITAGGQNTFEEHYLKSVGKIGLTVSKSRVDTEQSEGILAQAKSIKERVTGVSLDEETANMIKYQHAYEASAKVIKTADEMFNTLIGMMR